MCINFFEHTSREIIYGIDDTVSYIVFLRSRVLFVVCAVYVVHGYYGSVGQNLYYIANLESILAAVYGRAYSII